MKPHPSGRAAFVACVLICCALLSSCGTNATQGAGGSSKLAQIVITPANRSIPKGTNLRLSATGTFADGTQQNLSSSVTWQTSPSNIATIDPKGNLRALAIGVAQVSAAYQGMTASTSTTVGPPAPVSITVSSQRSSVPLGESEQVFATGSFTDGTTQNLTAFVTWEVTPPTVASINAQGDLKAMSQGVVQVSAGYEGITGSTTITVGAPALVFVAVSCNRPSLPVGETEPLTATGRYSDGSTQNLTASVTWQASPSTIASIDARGNLKALNRGVVQVSATYQGMTSVVSITVAAPALLRIAISPNQSALPMGESESLTAMGSFSDGTQQNLTQAVVWFSSVPAIATVTPAGAARAKSIGTTTISATAGSLTGTTNLTVKAAVVVGLSVTPATSSLILGSSSRLQAIAIFSDQTTQNMTSAATWSSTAPGIVGVSSGGLASAWQVGSATIRAQTSGFTGSASLTVTPLMTVSYFNRTTAANSGYDGTVRLVNPGFTAGDICGMVYVFDEKQELSECCGCKISDSGLQTLSLLNDLTANPLTGKQPVAGTIEIVPSNTGENGQCNAGSLDPNSMILGWETNVQGSPGAYRITETPFITVPLTKAQAQVLASECAIMQQLGSGQGTCSCGSGTM